MKKSDNEKVVCKVINNIKICTDATSLNPFEQTKEVYTIFQEHNFAKIQYANACSKETLTCISNNIKLLSFYFIIYFFAIIILNGLHELFHFSMFYFSNEKVNYIIFGINLGKTVIVEMPDVSSHSLIWWYFAILGPLLCVNFASIILIYILYTPIYHLNILTKNKMHFQIKENFLRAIAYISSLTILNNTILFPIFKMLFFNNNSNIQSDFIWAWEISLKMSNESIFSISEIYIGYLIIFIVFIILLVYTKLFTNKVIIAFFILYILSFFFFYNGISEQKIFQWLILSSISLEIIFSCVYIFQFENKISTK